MVDASENDTIQRRVAIPYGSRPSEPWQHPSVGAAASSIRPSRGKAERTEQSKFVPANPQPPLQARKPTNTNAPIIDPQRLNIIKRKKDDND